MGDYVYVSAKEVAAQVRARVKAAQKSGDLDRKWTISVRTDGGSMCSGRGVVGPVGRGVAPCTR